MINANTATSAHPAEAGHYGKDVRSDLHVSIEPRDSGGLEITLESRVGLYYGSSILSQTRQVLESLGVKHARISIHDEGALPFVISARIEAAAKRSGLGGGQRALPEKISLQEATTRDRLRRSRLYLPGSEPKYFINAALHGPDAIILDLEDSVHHAEKDAARILVRNTLRAVDFGSCERMVRISSCRWGWKIWRRLFPKLPTWC